MNNTALTFQGVLKTVLLEYIVVYIPVLDFTIGLHHTAAFIPSKWKKTLVV